MTTEENVITSTASTDTNNANADTAPDAATVCGDAAAPAHQDAVIDAQGNDGTAPAAPQDAAVDAQGNDGTVPTEPTDAASHAEAKKTGDRKTAVAVVIPFSLLEISKWNRSRDIAMDEKYIRSLAADINRNGLLHAVTLVKTSDGKAYRIVAGANRVAALHKLRRADSGLAQTEFRVLPDLTEDDKECLDVSIGENHHRRASSVYETAVYVNRLIEVECIKQDKVGSLLKMGRTKVSRYMKLADCFDQLPEGWRKELNTSPTERAASTISFAHWHEVTGSIKDGGVTPEIAGLLETAYDKRWSTRELRKSLKGLVKATPETASTDTEAKPQATETRGQFSPATLLKIAASNLRRAADALATDSGEIAAQVRQYAESVDETVRTLAAKAEESKQTAEVIPAVVAEQAA